MYMPKYYKVTNVDDIWDFVQNNSFGTIVTTAQGKPIATHLPLQLMKEGDTYYITGHIAYGNPSYEEVKEIETKLEEQTMCLLLFFSVYESLVVLLRQAAKELL
ncbi:FMN-binding negative transcriptional regulator [Bacillus atrophaeus]|nr:FMN-binding negative transcriptional regulator [Bacillus atrophaeus]MED4825162.1 FMN-binding negative transcriptional regulator [Bacillus atrophaeus]MED4842133.1 FMN-binding negative transcriptional regulator [Bacillus atrophaeus]